MPEVKPKLPVYPFGTVLQHSSLRHVMYLVLCPAKAAHFGTLDYYAIRLDADGRLNDRGIVVIGHTNPDDWNVLEITIMTTIDV